MAAIEVAGLAWLLVSSSEPSRAAAVDLGADRELHWARTISGPCDGETGQDLAVLPDGRFYMIGNYTCLDFDGDGKYDARAEGGTQDPLVGKFKADGYVEWLRAPRAPGFDRGSAVALDGSGGVYVVGRFHERLSFPSSKIEVRSQGDTDGFLARYDADGRALWATAVGGPGHDSLNDVAIDGAGNVYVTGSAGGRVVFHGTSTTLTVKGDPGPLVASFSPEGELRWTATVAVRGAASGGDVVVSPQGDVWVTGNNPDGGGMDFDGDGGNDLPAAQEETYAYVAHYGALGRFRWARALQGGVSGSSLAADGDLLVIGVLREATDFDGDGSIDAEAQGDARTFTALYTPDGSLANLRTFTFLATAWQATTDGDRLAFAGFYKGDQDLDGDGRIDVRGHLDGKAEILVAVLSSDGKLLDVFTGVGRGADQARAVRFTADRNRIIATGFMRLETKFSGKSTGQGMVKCDALGDLFVASWDVTPRLVIAPTPTPTPTL